MRKAILGALLVAAFVAPAALANHYSDLYILPVAAHTTGFNNTRFISDVSIQNFQSTPLTVQFLFIASGEGNPENVSNLVSLVLPSGTATVPAGGSVTLKDVLNGFEGPANPIGAILVSADKAFAVTSRAYTPLADGGTYGLTVPPVRDFIENTLGDTNNNAASAYLPGITQNVGFRSNAGFVAAAGRTGMGLNVIVRGANGATLGERAFSIPANTFVHTQFSVSSITAATFDAGSIEMQITTGDGAVTPYASIVDNKTADAVFVGGVFPTNATIASRMPSLFKQLFDRLRTY